MVWYVKPLEFIGGLLGHFLDSRHYITFDYDMELRNTQWSPNYLAFVLDWPWGLGEIFTLTKYRKYASEG